MGAPSPFDWFRLIVSFVCLSVCFVWLTVSHLPSHRETDAKTQRLVGYFQCLWVWRAKACLVAYQTHNCENFLEMKTCMPAISGSWIAFNNCLNISSTPYRRANRRWCSKWFQSYNKVGLICSDYSFFESLNCEVRETSFWYHSEPWRLKREGIYHWPFICLYVLHKLLVVPEISWKHVIFITNSHSDSRLNLRYQSMSFWNVRCSNFL